MQLTNADAPLRLLAAFHEHFPTLSPEWIVKAPDRDMWIAACIPGGEELTLIAPDQEGRAAFTWRTARLNASSTAAARGRISTRLD